MSFVKPRLKGKINDKIDGYIKGKKVIMAT